MINIIFIINNKHIYIFRLILESYYWAKKTLPTFYHCLCILLPSQFYILQLLNPLLLEDIELQFQV